jgi:formiminoglutamase
MNPLGGARESKTAVMLPVDPLWPRAGELLNSTSSGPFDVAVLGVPAHRTSLSPTNAHETPAAVRAALMRYSTWSGDHDVDLADLSWHDAGDVEDPDGPAGEERVGAAVRALMPAARLLVAIGGDNSITYSVGMGIWQGVPSRGGLITVDAHHDLRDGESNGSPVRRLVEAGMPGSRIVQIGIAEFANSKAYADRARDLGITVITRHALRRRGVRDVMTEALETAGQAPGGIHVDLDVDVCDRSVAPGCPASVPGGIDADELRRLAFLAAESPLVRSVDITEVDAAADAPDMRTVRLAALLVLESAAGLLCR